MGDDDSKQSYQPHQVVVNVLKNGGDRVDANAVAFHGHDGELKQAINDHRWLRALFLVVYKYTTGYGVYPQWSIIAIAFLTAAGAMVFRRTGELKEARLKWGLAYSFDMLLPLIKLRESHYKIDISGLARYYLYLHRLLGFILGSFLVAALASWVK